MEDFLDIFFNTALHHSFTKTKKRQLFEINTTITSVHDKTDYDDITRFFACDYGVNGGLGVCDSQRKKHTHTQKR